MSKRGYRFLTPADFVHPRKPWTWARLGGIVIACVAGGILGAATVTAALKLLE